MAFRQEYKIVRGQIGADDLEQRVNQYLQQGWRCSGSMVAPGAGYDFFQPIVRDNPVSDSE